MEVFIPIIVAAISISGTVIIGRWANETTLTNTNIDNANSLYDQYSKMNSDLRNEVSELRDELKKMREEIKTIKKSHSEKETFYENQIDLKDDEIEKLNDVIVEKDVIITDLKGGLFNG